jgi:hypothetical protein
MPKKKSIKLSVDNFFRELGQVTNYLVRIRSTSDLKDSDKTRCHDYAIIWLYRAFENLMLDSLSGAINNDTSALSASAGFAFPKHLSIEVCQFLVRGRGYFDFRGREGLIKKVREYVPETHYLVIALKKAKYKVALEQLVVLRNLAAHNSDQSKQSALKALNLKRLSSAGSWLKVGERFGTIAGLLAALAGEIEAAAPY